MVIVDSPMIMHYSSTTMTLLTMTSRPLRLNLMINLPIHTRKDRLTAKMNLARTVDAEHKINNNKTPAKLIISSMIHDNRIHFTVPIIRRVLVHPKLGFSDQGDNTRVNQQ